VVASDSLWIYQTGVYDADIGNSSEEVEGEERRYVTHIPHNGEEERIKNIRHTITKRWVVERTNSWHNRFRKLLVRYEKKSANYLALVQLVCCLIL